MRTKDDDDASVRCVRPKFTAASLTSPRVVPARARPVNFDHQGINVSLAEARSPRAYRALALSSRNQAVGCATTFAREFSQLRDSSGSNREVSNINFAVAMYTRSSLNG